MSAPPAAHAGWGRRAGAGGAASWVSGCRRDAWRDARLLPSARCRNQLGNSDLKAQTWTSLSHLVLWGGGLEMWHDLPSALLAKWFHCHDSLSAAACKSSCQLPAQQRSSNSKQDTVLIQPPETLGKSPDWAGSLFDLTPVGAIKWHMCLRYLPETSFAHFWGLYHPRSQH